MKWRALLTSVFLSVLFVGVYGFCNRVTALRGDVGVFVLPGEGWIPFVPAMIVPYMSIDLFFVIAPFFCSSVTELATFRRRIVTCIVVAGVCFLLVPLRVSVERPVAPGVVGAFFEWFKGMDLPFNQCPSLHIALRAVMVGTYARHTKGWVRGALQVWFNLIGMSTLLVYQHHVIDIVGGFVLGGAAYCVFQEGGWGAAGNRRVGAYYAVGAVVLVMLAVVMRPVGILLLWPAGALGVVAAGYFGAGAAIYRKRGGKVGAWARVVLWPVMVGQWASWWWYGRRSAAWDQLTERVWIGRQLTEAEARRAVAAGVTAVVDLTAEFSEARAFSGLKYLSVPVLDLTAPTREQVGEVVDFIERESKEGVVYVHCKAGYSRTAACVGAWMLGSGRCWGVEEVLGELRRVRIGMVVRGEARGVLENVAETLENLLGQPGTGSYHE